LPPAVFLPRMSVLLATLPRSGSWLLAEALENTGECGHPREYFRADYQPRYARAWGLPPDTGIRDYVGATIAAGSTPNGVFAAKVHWGQLRHLVAQLYPGADEPVPEAGLLPASLRNLRFVYLTREDKARQAISLHRATRSDVWWTLDDAAEDEPVELPTAADLHEIERLEEVLRAHEGAWCEFFARGGVVPLVVTYRELTEDYEQTTRRVMRFLELPLPKVVPPPRLKRQAGSSSAAWLRAYADYRAHRALVTEAAWS
jgi:trehalose 2-sulfotransferase